MSKVLAIIVILLVLGAGYWFVVDSKKGSTTGDTNTPRAQNETNNEEEMVGTWKSTEDPKFTREFKGDGTITDRYEGDASATSEGSWSVVDPTTETNFPAPVANFTGMTVVKTEWSHGEVMYFGINALTETNLNMTNISGRGNILMFTKVN